MYQMTHTSSFGFVFCLGVAAVSALSIAPATDASIVAQHEGSSDPLIEGWTTWGPGFSVSVGGINDGGTPAWMVNDSSTAVNTFLFYRRPLTLAEATDAAAIGWNLSTTIRVPSSTRPEDSFSPAVHYYDGATNWTMGFNVDSGNTVVQLVNGYSNFANSVETTLGPKYTLTGNSIYNKFELRFDPLSSTADLFINGVERISNYAGITDGNLFGPPGARHVQWGALSQTDSGHGNFNAVSFEINSAVVPECTSLVIWSLLTCVGFIVGSALRAKVVCPPSAVNA
jgi:hypothetical protein